MSFEVMSLSNFGSVLPFEEPEKATSPKESAKAASEKPGRVANGSHGSRSRTRSKSPPRAYKRRVSRRFEQALNFQSHWEIDNLDYGRKRKKF
jgi:hypothetical protein